MDVKVHVRVALITTQKYILLIHQFISLKFSLSHRSSQSYTPAMRRQLLSFALRRNKDIPRNFNHKKDLKMSKTHTKGGENTPNNKLLRFHTTLSTSSVTLLPSLAVKVYVGLLLGFTLNRILARRGLIYVDA